MVLFSAVTSVATLTSSYFLGIHGSVEVVAMWIFPAVALTPSIVSLEQTLYPAGVLLQQVLAN